MSRHKITGYRFLDRDPIVDLCMYAIDQSGFRISQIAGEANHGVAESTIRNVAYGKTRRPTHNTVRTIIEACGGQEVFIFPGATKGHDVRARVDYDAKARKEAIQLANGRGWHGIDPIHPRRLQAKLKALPRASGTKPAQLPPGAPNSRGSKD